MMSLADIFYLSGRKSAASAAASSPPTTRIYYDRILTWLPVYEGFSTYGGMSTKEIEAMAVGLREMTDTDVAGERAGVHQVLRQPAEETASRW